ncbi:MAG: hypothetical protein ACWGOY_03030, partial [Anaerolineales bacterium]
ALFRNFEDLCQLAVQIAHARDLAGQPLSEAQRILAQYHASFMDLQALFSETLILGSFSASEYTTSTSIQNPGISPSSSQTSMMLNPGVGALTPPEW